jgi:hypothetical protein
MMGKLPEQKLIQWHKEADEVRPKRDEAQRTLEHYQYEESRLLREGARATQAKDMSWQRDVAERLMRRRRESKRVRTQFAIQDRQLQVLETRIHNADIKQVGETIKLPTAGELAQESADAELVMQEITEVADLAATIEVGAGESYISSQSEEDILAEFAAVASANKPDVIPEPTAEITPAETAKKPLWEKVADARLEKEHRAEEKN